MAAVSATLYSVRVHNDVTGVDVSLYSLGNATLTDNGDGTSTLAFSGTNELGDPIGTEIRLTNVNLHTIATAIGADVS